MGNTFTEQTSITVFPLEIFLDISLTKFSKSLIGTAIKIVSFCNASSSETSFTSELSIEFLSKTSTSKPFDSKEWSIAPNLPKPIMLTLFMIPTF